MNSSGSRAGPTRWAMASLALSMLMPSLDTSIANVGLPAIGQAFNASFQQVQWIVLAYLLAITTLVVSAGRLGDIFGRRRMLLAGIGLFTAASLACGVAPSLWMLVSARAAQGLGAAVMMALTLSLLGETAPRGRTGSAMGLLGSMSAIGTTLGPSLGGILIAGLGWRWIFLVNVPVGILNIVLAARTLPLDQRVEGANRTALDFTGTALLAGTLGAYALAMTSGNGRIGLANIALLVVAAFGLMLFVAAQRRAVSPLVRVGMLKDATLAGGLAMSAVVSTVMMTTLVVGPFYLSRALGLDAGRVGLTMSLGPLVAALAGVPAGRLVDRFGARRTSVAGLTGLSSGLLIIVLASGRFGLPGYVTGILIVTAHYALFQAANNTKVMSGVHPEQRGVVSGLLSLSRNLGLITGAAVMGAVFSAVATSDVSSAQPAVIGAALEATFLVCAFLVLVAMAITRTRDGAEALPAGP
jgi:EmrB/QacA subfamily drug resistance transporter